MAVQESVATVSHYDPIVAFLLFEPVDLLVRRVISLWGYKAASYCPKFECILDLKRKEEDVAQSG